MFEPEPDALKLARELAEEIVRAAVVERLGLSSSEARELIDRYEGDYREYRRILFVVETLEERLVEGAAALVIRRPLARWDGESMLSKMVSGQTYVVEDLLRTAFDYSTLA